MSEIVVEQQLTAYSRATHCSTYEYVSLPNCLFDSSGVKSKKEMHDQNYREEAETIKSRISPSLPITSYGSLIICSHDAA
ncbi:hypothetical protein I8F73_04335 [Enterococcus faecalis]|nr:hypothetical protein [Enterococcus faecalis]